MPKKQLASEALIDLHRRLSALPFRSHERRVIMQETAHLYGLSEQTLYRALAQRAPPKALCGWHEVAAGSRRKIRGKMVGRGVECRGRRKGQVRTIPVGVSFRFPHRLTTSG